MRIMVFVFPFSWPQDAVRMASDFSIGTAEGASSAS
jgi:hypothetical protein